MKLNVKMAKEKRKILLLIDNCPSHKIIREYSNIEILFFPKNTTGILQPLDRGIIKNFKTFFRGFKLSSIINKIADKNDIYTIYKNLTLKDAIIFSDLAWQEVKKESI